MHWNAWPQGKAIMILIIKCENHSKDAAMLFGYGVSAQRERRQTERITFEMMRYTRTHVGNKCEGIACA